MKLSDLPKVFELYKRLQELEQAMAVPSITVAMRSYTPSPEPLCGRDALEQATSAIQAGLKGHHERVLKEIADLGVSVTS